LDFQFRYIFYNPFSTKIKYKPRQQFFCIYFIVLVSFFKLIASIFQLPEFTTTTIVTILALAVYQFFEVSIDVIGMPKALSTVETVKIPDSLIT
jgi:hypothetical protein